jgi:AcrR family transcriptional regulator
MGDVGAGAGRDSATARRGRRTPSADVARELLSAAEEVLARDGPGGLTVRAVAAEAALAPMAVYSRLGGKDGLINALLIRGFDRLRAAVDTEGEPDLLEQLRSRGLRYRQFALANPNFYAIMFEGAVPRDGGSGEAREHAAAAFGVLVRSVRLAAAAGLIEAPDAPEAAQQIWSAVHGAVVLELRGLALTPDPAATYEALLRTLIRGLAPGREGQE